MVCNFILRVEYILYSIRKECCEIGVCWSEVTKTVAEQHSMTTYWSKKDLSCPFEGKSFFQMHQVSLLLHFLFL